ncbi:MAG: exocyst complex component exo84 [Chaenotheca gracillima]|nr:MAG: exocyst complex component exo84 [Chaenotheca gracillima]
MAEIPSTSPGLTQSKPYPPTVAALGGLPTVGLDVPITAVFLVLFLCSAVTHMTILQRNNRRGHKFVISGALFGFSMARITTCVLRIVWATRPHQAPVGIAAAVFVAAGVLLVFVINIIFTQRIIRAVHPHFGWNPFASRLLIVYWVAIVLSLAMLITCTVQSFFTLHPNTRRIDRDVQLFGTTWLTIAAFMPWLLVPAALLIPHRNRIENFGSGRFRTKVAVLLTASAVLTLGAAFRCGTLFLPPRPINNPAWYHSKACFYLFDFTTEVFVLYLYAIARVDRLFWIPNGSSGPGDYAAGHAGKEGAPFRGRNDEEQFDEAPESRTVEQEKERPFQRA